MDYKLRPGHLEKGHSLCSNDPGDSARGQTPDKPLTRKRSTVGHKDSRVLGEPLTGAPTPGGWAGGGGREAGASGLVLCQAPRRARCAHWPCALAAEGALREVGRCANTH